MAGGHTLQPNAVSVPQLLTTIAEHENIVIVIFSAGLTLLILAVVLGSLEEHGRVEFGHLGLVLDGICGYNWSCALLDHLDKSGLLLHELTSELTEQLDNIEIGTTCRAAVGTFDPWLETVIVKIVPAWLKVCDQIGGIRVVDTKCCCGRNVNSIGGCGSEILRGRLGVDDGCGCSFTITGAQVSQADNTSV